MFGATASGHKFNPLIIGNTENPRTFKEDTIDSHILLIMEMRSHLQVTKIGSVIHVQM